MLAALATSAVLAAGGHAPGWQPGVLAAEAFARTRRGAVAFAVRTECGAWGRRQDRTAPSASVLKAMLLVAYLQRDARRWGMRRFGVDPQPWGMSRITAGDQARFWLHLDRRLPP